MDDFALGIFLGIMAVLCFGLIGERIRKRKIKILRDALQQVANSPSAWQSDVFQEVAKTALEEACGNVSIDESNKKE